MQFLVDLQSEEYRRAMIWHQFASTAAKRMNDWAAWAILVAVPLTVVVLLIFAPDALSLWFWPVALMALLYSAYSTIIIRYQIGKQAQTLLQANPILTNTLYHVHEKGVKLSGATVESEIDTLFLPWKEIARVAESHESYLIFVTDLNILIIPKRTLPDDGKFRRLLVQTGKLAQ